MEKIVVVHFGKQHVFRLLQSLLVTKKYDLKFITGAYYKPFSLYWIFDKVSFRLFNRMFSKIRLIEFPNEDVILYNQSFAIFLAVLVRIDREKKLYNFFYRLAYKRFVHSVINKVMDLDPDIVIFYDANYIAQELKRINPKLILIYDVAMATFRKTKSLESIEKKRSPRYSSLFIDEDRYLSSTNLAVIDAGILASDYFIVGSDFVKKSLNYYKINEDRVFVVNYGVDVNFDYSDKKISKPYNVIFVGRAVQRKGVGYFLDVLSSYEFKHLINPILIGDNKLLLKSNLFDLDGIHLTGHIEKRELIEILKVSTFLYNPTLIEGMSLAILEAMSYGIIPITTENSGYSSIIKDGVNGFIVDYFEFGRVHQILNNLINNSDLMSRISYNAYMTSRDFTWGKYSIGIEKSIRKILLDNPKRDQS